MGVGRDERRHLMGEVRNLSSHPGRIDGRVGAVGSMPVMFVQQGVATRVPVLPGRKRLRLGRMGWAVSRTR